MGIVLRTVEPAPGGFTWGPHPTAEGDEWHHCGRRAYKLFTQAGRGRRQGAVPGIGTQVWQPEQLALVHRPARGPESPGPRVRVHSLSLARCFPFPPARANVAQGALNASVAEGRLEMDAFLITHAMYMLQLQLTSSRNQASAHTD